MEGQLTTAERNALFEEVCRRQPYLVLEVGTWRGGGSTFQIVSALAKLGRGHLHTCEPDPGLHSDACAVYRDEVPHLQPFVTLHRLYSGALIYQLLSSNQIPDMVFMDGPEDPEIGMQDLMTLERVVKPGFTFSMHDWHHELSVKQRKVKPYIETSPKWRIDRVLHPPESVGLVFATYLG